MKSYTIFLFLFLFPLSLIYGQEDTPQAFQQEVKKETEEAVSKLKTRGQQILNFFAMYSATYAGEHDEYINKLKGNLIANETNASPMVQDLIDEIALSGGMLEKAVNTFNQQTGVRLYSIGEIKEAFADDKFAQLFNRMSASKNVYYNAPAFILHAKVQGNKEVGWSAEISIELNGITAEAITAFGGKSALEKLYNDQLQSNYSQRRDDRKAVRNALYNGSRELGNKIGTALKPDPHFYVNHEIYGPTSTVKLFNHNGNALVQLRDANDAGIKVKKWTGAKGIDHEDSTSYALIDVTAEGELVVTANITNKKSYAINVDVRAVPEKFDELLTEVLATALDSLMARAERKLQKEEDTDKYWEKFIAYNEQSKEAFLAQDFPEGISISLEKIGKAATQVDDNLSASTALADLSFLLPQTDFHQNFMKEFENYVKEIKAEQLKKARYVMAVVLVKPENFEKLLTKMRADLPTLAGKLLAKLIMGEGKEEMKAFLITHLEVLMDAVILDSLGEGGKEIYKMINSGSDKDEIRTRVAELLSESIVNEL